jgi:SAM-dependent methyltransferase
LTSAVQHSNTALNCGVMVPDSPEALDQRYLQQAGWTAVIRRQAFQRFGLRQAARILEVGSGTGAITSELRSSSPGAVIGLDRDQQVNEYARRSHPGVACVTGLGERLPFPDSSFDLVCCHFLLLWVVDPLHILKEMLRVTRPGGGVLCLAEPDYGGRIEYPESLSALGALQEQSLRARGADPRLGRRLRMLLHEAGLTQVQVGVLGGEWAEEAGRPASTEGDLEWRTLSDDLKDLYSPSDLRRLESEFARARQDGSHILFVPTFFGWGLRPTRPERMPH